MKKKLPKIIRPPLEEAEEFVKEVKKQVTGKEPLPPEVLGGGSAKTKKQLKKVQEAEEEELRGLRMEKAQMLAEWRRRRQELKAEEAKVIQEETMVKEAGEKQAEVSKDEVKQKKTLASGESALAATGASQKKPTGLWGIGGKFKKMFKWATFERKGRAPK